jgi:hypothetical protein
MTSWPNSSAKPERLNGLSRYPHSRGRSRSPDSLSIHSQACASRCPRVDPKGAPECQGPLPSPRTVSAGTSERFIRRTDTRVTVRQREAGDVPGSFHSDWQVRVHPAYSARVYAPAKLGRKIRPKSPQPDYSGIFPCFFAGFLSRFVPSISKA